MLSIIVFRTEEKARESWKQYISHESSKIVGKQKIPPAEM